MRILLIAVGTRMPAWVAAGFAEYASRLPRECSLHLIEIPPNKRGKHSNLEKIRQAEGERILAAVPHGTRVIALDAAGQQWDTETFAKQFNAWLAEGQDVALLVGGPDGLDSTCRAHAEMTWSLSLLTFPHALVRIIVAEQIYRAWTLRHHHPYHRG